MSKAEIRHRVINDYALPALQAMEPKSVDCVVSSPPYYKQRDYGYEGQWGQEDSVEEYIDNLRRLMLELRRVVKDSGTVWINLSDSYGSVFSEARQRQVKKTLLMIPARFMLAGVSAGFCLRNHIVWAKSNARPEPVKNRFSKKHESVMFFTLGDGYYFDLGSVSQAAAESSKKRMQTVSKNRSNTALSESRTLIQGQNKGAMSNGLRTSAGSISHRTDAGAGDYLVAEFDEMGVNPGDVADFWTIPAASSSKLHFATFPEKLASYCILAGCPPDGVVLDPFCGSGVSGVAAKKLGRRFIGIDASEEYADMTFSAMEAINSDLFTND